MKIKKLISNINTKIKKLVFSNIPECLFILGVIYINYATFLINHIAFLYVLGTTFIILGIAAAKT
ncbi:hypothetical protein [Tepidibacter mesophilus]|uniref:hypothetical protein n=1 Tax=Tepidibacter mesophilus TaxID=655607 RepID=UPI000C06B1F7|nr:hypothetical protein [Tepidibacter mesophilus]